MLIKYDFDEVVALRKELTALRASLAKAESFIRDHEQAWLTGAAREKILVEALKKYASMSADYFNSVDGGACASEALETVKLEE